MLKEFVNVFSREHKKIEPWQSVLVKPQYTMKNVVNSIFNES